MKTPLLFLPISLMVLLTEVSLVMNISSTTTTVNNRLLSGIWKSTIITNNTFTNNKLVDKENSTNTEIYTFQGDNTFSLTQGAFSIKGKWDINKEGNLVTVTTESGEAMQWQIQSLSSAQLKLFRSETTQMVSKTHRLETLVSCSRIVQ
ncbi:hypothetical protein QNI19_14035 [Cytophagaceae bacterium DM2B3-1]|uniref:Lipocalin-like domain-containing protein n=1 Tax=Xanthocytophaga flava TaxID=3048013 RepID=A0ABT7CJY6_9BACT|nr:hypothetical protein [Xanthocytophaga flavus]MDJ1469430.1 hypothetical protein [Xanthocytophaga flavus]MDJ1494058.1 hypothetical protein [Xanthocytophaga flavus]